MNILYRLLTLCVFTFSLLHLQAQTTEEWKLRVNDQAKLLSQATLDMLDSQLKAYEDSTSNQIAILTITSLKGEPIESYALQEAKKLKLGQASKDNGVLIVIAAEEHAMRIEVGKGLEGVLTDAHSSRIIRNEMASNFRRGDYDTGVQEVTNAIIAAIGGEYAADDLGVTELSLTARVLLGVGIYLFLGIFAFFVLIIPGAPGWYGYLFLIPFFSVFPAFVMGEGLGFVPGVSFIVIFPIIKLLVGQTNWAKNLLDKIDSGSGSGSGKRSGRSWSSGSGSFSRSSGSSFSGGGGSFGGGGSSGSW